MRIGKGKLEKLTDGELEKIIDKDEHNFYQDDDDLNSYGRDWMVHAYWDCETCDAEDELKNRINRKNSLKPGNLPYYVGGGVSKSIIAVELKEGDIVKYHPKPGTEKFYYVEAIEIGKSSSKVRVKWRKTNSPNGKIFSSKYSHNDYIPFIFRSLRLE